MVKDTCMSNSIASDFQRFYNEELKVHGKEICVNSWGQVTSDQVTSDQVTSDQVTSDQMTSYQVTLDQVTSDQSA